MGHVGDMIARGVRALASRSGATFSYYSASSATTTPDLPGVVVELDDDRTSQRAAKNISVTVEVDVLATALPGDGVIWNGNEYRIVEVTDVQGAAWRILATLPRLQA